LASAFIDQSMGNADAESFAIPFLQVLQGNSPQCIPEDGKYIDGAVRGKILDTVTQELHDDLEVFPVYFKREFIEWILRSLGGGIVDRHLPESAPAYKETEVDGKYMWLMENGHQLVDTRQHYVLFRPITEDGSGAWRPAMIGMTSSKIKVSKRLMTMITDQRKSGVLMSFRFSTVGEVKNSDHFSNWAAIPLNDVTADSDLLNEAMAFQKACQSNAVKVQGEDDNQEGPGDDLANNANF